MQEQLFDKRDDRDLLSIQEASEWATALLGKNVTPANISYLVQYGRVRNQGNETILVSKTELQSYYKSYLGKKEVSWKQQLGDDLNWRLSFDYLKEAETTKHVHRLHPYKGKFIPQLVEYFLDTQTDEFKKDIFFQPGDIVLDPFCGSGTTLVQAGEMGLHAIGVDISHFNTLMCNVKVGRYDLKQLAVEIKQITDALNQFLADNSIVAFEAKLTTALSEFNNVHFPAYTYKYKVAQKLIDGDTYGEEKAELFRPTYDKLVAEYEIALKQNADSTFLDKWYLQGVRSEIEFVHEQIKRVAQEDLRNVLLVILSRTVRSCRATTHADLATLKEPVTSTYYCAKHGKVCKPLFSIKKWWDTYCKDTLERLSQYAQLRTPTSQVCLTGDSRVIEIIAELRKQNHLALAETVAQRRVRGIFSSPPYIGLIDYHEQHAYAYELFAFQRRDEFEIGPMSKGQSRAAKEEYIEGIADVLRNSQRFLIEDYNIFLVANDKYNLYPAIAEKAGMTIVNRYKRPVLNRSEKDKGAYSEDIFHLKRNHKC
jgi:hypothetical protein